MLNKIWPIFIISSIVYAVFSGNVLNINEAMLNSPKETIEIILNLLGNICLWSGIMEIAINSKIKKIISKLISPFINKLFPEIENKKTKEKISINMIANMMGMGNAATSIGIDIMQELQKENKNKKELSNSMIMLIVINTASLQIIPTTVISIRNSLGSKAPLKVLLPIWIASFVSIVFATIATKIFIKMEKTKNGNN